MQKGTKIKNATNRINARTQTNAATKQSNWRKFWNRVWWIVCWPFRQIARICRKIWNWICEIDLIGLVNITLLVAIIVMFSMLIIDILRFKKSDVVIVTPHTVEVTNDKYQAPHRVVKQRTPTLPIKRDARTNKLRGNTIKAVSTPAPTILVAQDRATGIMYGDIVIDNRGDAAILYNGAHIHGNVYLQNMRKYTLPCNIKINGNLFLRDLNMLHFCGDFTITGNIYVSPRSSFGPIPRTARLGGQVVL